MNSFIKHEDIELNLDMHLPPFELKGKGWAHPATLMKSCATDDLSKLLTLTLWGEKVIAVERFATMHQNQGWAISLLLPKKFW
jgi:hypothetical protein